MKEAKFLGTLLPAHPDFIPIKEAIREKYNLPEISPDDGPITEIYLGDEFVSLEEFRNDIENRIRENLSFMPPDLLKVYLPAMAFSKAQRTTLSENEAATLPDEIKSQYEVIVKFTETMINFIVQPIDSMIRSIADTLYINLLTGETEEIPNDWISQVVTVTSLGAPMVLAMAGPMANLDVIVQQFREEYRKSFGAYHPKITNTAVSTAYYLRLKRDGKRWDYIVEEYIRLSKFILPRDRSSKQYQETWRRCEQRLKKRMQRTEAVLSVLIRDKK